MELQGLAPAEGSWDFLGKKVKWGRVVPARQLSGCVAVGQTATPVQLELRKWAATAAFFERKWRGKVKGSVSCVSGMHTIILVLTTLFLPLSGQLLVHIRCWGRA